MIAARARLDERQLSQPDTDRKAVIQYFESRAEGVDKVLSALRENTVWLAARRGTGTRAPILDVYPSSPEHLRQVFDTLAQVWGGQAMRKPRWVANALAEVLNHIRNHMFHGLKNPDDAADQELLEHMNPILLGVLELSPDAG